MARASITALCLFCGQELVGKQKSEGFCSPLHALEYYQSRQKDDDLGDTIFRYDEEAEEEDPEAVPAPDLAELTALHHDQAPESVDDAETSVPIALPSLAIPNLGALDLSRLNLGMASLGQQDASFESSTPTQTTFPVNRPPQTSLRIADREISVIGPLTTLAETQFLDAMMPCVPGPSRPLGLLLAEEPIEELPIRFPQLGAYRIPTGDPPMHESQVSIEWRGRPCAANSISKKEPQRKEIQGVDLRPAWVAFPGLDSSGDNGHGNGKLGVDYAKRVAFRRIVSGQPDLTMPAPAKDPNTATQRLPIPEIPADQQPGGLKTNSFALPKPQLPEAVAIKPTPFEKLLARFGKRKVMAVATGVPVLLLAAFAIPAFLNNGPKDGQPVASGAPAIIPHDPGSPVRVAPPGSGVVTTSPNVVPELPPNQPPVEIAGNVEANPDHEQTLRSLIESRKAIEMADDFHMGLSNWSSKKGGGPDWRYDPTGFVIPRSLSLLKPSLEMKDYSMEFLTKIDVKAVSWVARASDFSNYCVVKLVERAGGPLPKMTLQHYSVVAGRAGPRKEVRLPITVYKDTLYRVRMDIRGSLFAVWVQGALVDSWTEERLPVGGIGFFNASGESARIRWVQLTHQNDTIGKIFAYIAPLAQSGSGSQNQPAPQQGSPDTTGKDGRPAAPR